MRALIPAIAAALLVAGCSDDGLTTTEVKQAAMQRVSDSAGLTMESAHFGDIFVGKSRTGEEVLCGTISGARPDGTPVPAVRFIAGLETESWVAFERNTGFEPPSQPDKYAEWHTACLGERTVPR